MIIDRSKLEILTPEQMLQRAKTRLTRTILQTTEHAVRVVVTHPFNDHVELHGAAGWAQKPNEPEGRRDMVYVSFAKTAPPVFYVNEVVKMYIHELSVLSESEPVKETPVIDEAGHLEEEDTETTESMQEPAVKPVKPLPDEPTAKPLDGEPVPEWFKPKSYTDNEVLDFRDWLAKHWQERLNMSRESIALLDNAGYSMRTFNSLGLRVLGGIYKDIEDSVFDVLQEARMYLTWCAEPNLKSAMSRYDSELSVLLTHWEADRPQPQSKPVGILAAGTVMANNTEGYLMQWQPNL